MSEARRPFADFHVGIFSGLQMIPVPTGHECAPAPGTVNMSDPPGFCYVLDSEWPALEAALRREVRKHERTE